MTFVCTLLARFFNAGNSMLFFSTGLFLLILFPRAEWAQVIAFTVLGVTAYVGIFLFGIIQLLPKDGRQAVLVHFRGNIISYLFLVLGTAILAWLCLLQPFNRIGVWTTAAFVFIFLVLAPWAYRWHLRSQQKFQMPQTKIPVPTPITYD